MSFYQKSLKFATKIKRFRKEMKTDVKIIIKKKQQKEFEFTNH